MTPTDARAKVKVKFDIPAATTTLDATIDECVEQAALLLAPFVNIPLTVDTTVSLDSSTYSFTLPEAGSTVKRLHLTYSDGHSVLWTDYSQHGDEILLTEAPGGAVTVGVYAEKNLGTADTVPERFSPAYVDFTCSEFATVLAGSKSKYNIYAQSTGARGVDNMLDLAEFYEQRAERRVSRVADSEGVL